MGLYNFQSQKVIVAVIDGSNISDTYPNESFVLQYLYDNEQHFREVYKWGTGSCDLDDISDIDDSGDELSVEIAEGTRLYDNHDVLHHVMMVQVAGWLRYQRCNVFVEDDEEFIGPIPDDIGFVLSSVYRAHPLPMAIRTYNVIPSIILSCARDMNIVGDDGQRAPPRMLTADILFMAILNRLTGRPNIYITFKQCFPGLTDTVLPRIKIVKNFLDFVEENNCHKRLFNTQHLNSIPIDLRLYQHVFIEFVNHLADDTEDILHSIMQARRVNRKECVVTLGSKLHSLVEFHKTHLHERNASDQSCKWIAHQVLADLEEVFIDPFGSVIAGSVMYGFGSKQGWYVCFGEKYRDDGDSPIELLDWFKNELLREHQGGSSMLRHDVLGLCYDDIIGESCVMINGRPIGLTDIEHFLCKVYIGTSKTISTRCTSKIPFSSKPGLHPIKLSSGQKLPWDDHWLKEIASNAIDSFKECLVNGTVVATPECFLHKGEIDPLIDLTS